MTVKEILSSLKKFDDGKYTYEDLLDKLSSIDIFEEFEKLNDECKLAKEKGLMWESLLNY